MSQMIKLDEACYEGLRCSVCAGYLSFSPIRWLLDGSVLCGRCSPLNNEIPCRALIVESLLSNATFPCRYEQFGCSTNVLFNRASNHEDGCMHRPFPCASLPYTSCAWEGPPSQVSDHFVDKHSDFVQQEAKIKLSVDQDKEGVLLVKAASATFIMRYTFDSTICSLRYQIRLCIGGTDSQDCKLHLFNDADFAYSVKLKAKCFAYNANFSNENFLNVDVKSLFAALNNPDSFTVAFHVKLPTPPDDGSLNNEVDYKLLDLNRCAGCQYYLVPPLFDCNEKIICADCSSECSSTPTTTKTLETMLTQKNFPCRWQGCNFIGKGGVIGSHQSECDFRMYSCPDLFCHSAVKRSCVAQHMEAHGYHYFSGQYIHKFKFDSYDEKKMYSVVDNEIIEIRLSNFEDDTDHYIYFRFINKNKKNKMVGKVYFSHEHCKCRSKEFSFPYRLPIRFSDLPKCFTENDITYATVWLTDDLIISECEQIVDIPVTLGEVFVFSFCVLAICWCIKRVV